MSYEIKGEKALLKQLKKNAKMQDIKDAVKLNGSDMQNKAMRAVPVDTGNLKRSITLEEGNDGLSAKVSASSEYSEYVEKGTRYMDAQPYMKPSYLQQKILFYKDLLRLVK